MKGTVDEFSLINTWFNCTGLQPHTRHIVLGNGDDCAIIAVPAGKMLAQSMDTLVADVHFPASAPADLIGYRALAVSVSDLAAMGAIPHSYSLALTLPEADASWLNALSQGLASLSKQCDITLIGGDTTRGPLTLSFHVQGFVDSTNALQRSGAKPGDRIFISGTLGDAAGALPFVLKGAVPNKARDVHQVDLLNAYYYPQPQLALGRWLAMHGAHAVIDISDGLLADLNHILVASNAGATLNTNTIPLSEALCALYGQEEAIHLALTAGDDYQLCFCWPANRPLPEGCPVPVTEIGIVTEATGIVDQSGKVYDNQGFKHF